MTVRELLKVKIGGKRYYQDDRLKEFRAIYNPHDRITYEKFFKKRETGRKKYIDISKI